MTKAEIVAEISKMTGVERDKALRVVEAFMQAVKEQTANGEDVFLRGFGTSTTIAQCSPNKHWKNMQHSARYRLSS